MASTKDVLNHHLKAFEQGDLNGVLSDYGPGRRLFHKGGAAQGRRRDQALVRGLDRRVWETRGNIQHAAASDRRRLRLYFMDSKDRRQCLRTGYGHVRRARGQDCRPVIHR